MDQSNLCEIRTNNSRSESCTKRRPPLGSIIKIIYSIVSTFKTTKITPERRITLNIYSIFYFLIIIINIMNEKYNGKAIGGLLFVQLSDR